MDKQQYWRLALFIAAPLTVALTAHRSESLRPQPPELRADASFVVISGRDSGGGTLREAIVTAARQEGRVRIVIHVAHITLLSPLPPLVNAGGVVLDAGTSRCQLDAGAIGDVPAIEIASVGSTIAGLRIRNARNAGILARAPRATLRNVAVSDSSNGVILQNAPGSIIETSSFERNTTGIRIDATSPGTTIRNSQFGHNDGAGIWAVAATPAAAVTLRIEGNTFHDDRISIVLANVDAMLTRNDIRRAAENAIYLMQSRSVVRSNRIVGGVGGGILMDRADTALLDRNEIDHNGLVGILVRSSRGATVQGNVLYANAYGIASVFGDRAQPNVIAENLIVNDRIDGIYVIGSSPLLRANRVLRNGGAAARVLDFVPWTGAPIPSDPRFEGNTFSGNRLDQAVHGEYHPQRAPEPSS